MKVYILIREWPEGLGLAPDIEGVYSSEEIVESEIAKRREIEPRGQYSYETREVDS